MRLVSSQRDLLWRALREAVQGRDILLNTSTDEELKNILQYEKGVLTRLSEAIEIASEVIIMGVEED